MLLQAAINVPTAAEVACSPTVLNSGSMVQLLQALATLDVQTAAKLGITRLNFRSATTPPPGVLHCCQPYPPADGQFQATNHSVWCW